jgi:hypothetical protein
MLGCKPWLEREFRTADELIEDGMESIVKWRQNSVKD